MRSTRLAGQIAQTQATTAGRVLSDLARQTVEPTRARRVRNGVPLLPRRPKGAQSTLQLVNRLRDGA